MPKTIKVTRESSSGRNQRFRDTRSGISMTRAQFAQKIQGGKFPDYHIRKINGLKTPASNPDKSESNNLG